MERSLREFKQDFLDTLLKIHWRQWGSLGVVSHVEPEGHWIIDLESLIISTFFIGLKDKKLLSAAMKWMTENGEWINLSRYKRIKKIFLTADIGHPRTLLNPALFDHMPPSMSRYAQPDRAKNWLEMAGSPENGDDYEGFFRAMEIQGATRELNIQQPPLLQLLLRSVFGIEARAEVLIYFLCHESGNSNSIARELFFDQKAVYRIIERWKAAGVLETVPGGKIGNCSLKKEEAWVWVLGLSGKADYFNWVRLFYLCARVLGGLSDERIVEDEDQAASYFRGLYEDTRSVGKPLGVEIPDPRFYQGPEYASVFMSAITRIQGLLKGM